MSLLRQTCLQAVGRSGQVTWPDEHHQKMASLRWRPATVEEMLLGWWFVWDGAYPDGSIQLVQDENGDVMLQINIETAANPEEDTFVIWHLRLERVDGPQLRIYATIGYAGDTQRILTTPTVHQLVKQIDSRLQGILASSMSTNPFQGLIDRHVYLISQHEQRFYHQLHELVQAAPR